MRDPIVPPAPGRLSTITVPRRCDSFSAINRAITSTGPPAGNGAISRIGRLGEVLACAGASAQNSTPTAASIARIVASVLVIAGWQSRRRMTRFLRSLGSDDQSLQSGCQLAQLWQEDAALPIGGAAGLLDCRGGCCRWLNYRLLAFAQMSSCAIKSYGDITDRDGSRR